MIELVLTVMLSSLSLGQNGSAAITTNELAPPAGMSDTREQASPRRQDRTNKGAQAEPSKGTPSPSAPPPETPGQSPSEKVNGVTVENATPAPTENSQPTTEEKQAPSAKQAGGTASPGRVAAFWFILPNRPAENK